MKINFDVDCGSNFMVFAMVSSNHDGAILFVVTSLSTLSSPIVDEAKAAVIALTETLDRKLLCFVVEGDSEVTIDNLNSESSNWEIANSVAMAKEIGESFWVHLLIALVGSLIFMPIT